MVKNYSLRTFIPFIKNKVKIKIDQDARNLRLNNNDVYCIRVSIKLLSLKIALLLCG